LLASASNDETIKIWDLAINLCIRTLIGYGGDGYYSPMAFSSPDDSYLAVGLQVRDIHIWDIASGYCCLFLKDEEMINCVVWTSDGKSFVAARSAAYLFYLKFTHTHSLKSKYLKFKIKFTIT
jgi:WD40 repeat protein